MEQELLKYHREGNWKAILKMFSGLENNEKLSNKLYLWIQPSQDDLDFIGQQLLKQNALLLTSVGCGTGLLEWLIHCTTGIPVIGIEVDRQWWESQYAPPTFIPFLYADEENTLSLSSTSAILFCYFNNRQAFYEYMKVFQGNCLIIIGPQLGSGRHTDPNPYDPEVLMLGWKFVSSKEIQNTQDVIAVYERCCSAT